MLTSLGVYNRRGFLTFRNAAYFSFCGSIELTLLLQVRPLSSAKVHQFFYVTAKVQVRLWISYFLRGEIY